MAKETFERSYPGKTPQEIFEAARKTIDEVASRHSLEHQVDAAKLEGKVSRMGAKGSYRVAGEKITLELEFGMLVPGVVRKRVGEEVSGRLDKLFG
ncbi:MAG TPA: polyhydroxyalkanoic acid system family protein [Myxococcales bacterium]|nr:polyhydroxyalkanoic acid system family protein [Myxococcales bacterium]